MRVEGAGRAAALLAASAALAALLEGIGIPAGLLLGPLIAGAGLAATGRAVRIPPLAFGAGQAIVGVMIGAVFTPSLLREVASRPGLFAGTTAATLAASVAIGWMLHRARVLPDGVAIWGTMPGAATAMTLIAREEGADWRLVASMSYLRVVLVAGFASALAATLGGGAGGVGTAWFPSLQPAGLGETLIAALLGAWAGPRLRIPAGGLLGPMALAALLGIAGLGRFQLPGWLLAAAYATVGWRIGLSFTPEIVRVVWQTLPRILAALGVLIAFCAGMGVLLARLAGQSVMTGYLATSPGGADSVAIIARSTPVDVPFVMAMQVFRFLAVLAAGPWLARRLAGARAKG